MLSSLAPTGALTLEALLRALRGTAAISGMILFIHRSAADTTVSSQILSFSGDEQRGRRKRSGILGSAAHGTDRGRDCWC